MFRKKTRSKRRDTASEQEKTSGCFIRVEEPEKDSEHGTRQIPLLSGPQQAHLDVNRLVGAVLGLDLGLSSFFGHISI